MEAVHLCVFLQHRTESLKHDKIDKFVQRCEMYMYITHEFKLPTMIQS